MIILILNCGSSSIKFKLYNVEKDIYLAEGKVEKIGEEKSIFSYSQASGKKKEETTNIPDHEKGLKIITDALVSQECGVIKSLDEINGVGHRVVHGGEDFSKATLITDEVIQSIKKYTKLAPLHNPPALSGIKACLKLMPNVSQVAVFDTAFHQTIPPKAYMYAIPYKYYQKYKLRRYGFHGTSHNYIASKASRILGKSIKELKIITCHLGNGCSIAAVDKGISVDTSMGFTPLEGLVMGTRSGDLDPAIVAFLEENEKISCTEIDTILNKKSGLLGLSGVSNDMRELNETKNNDTTGRVGLALEVFFYRIKKYIGTYTAVMNGIDAIVLTGGIGENNPWIVEKLKKELSNIIEKFDVKILVIPTKEEWMIASETAKLVKKL